MKPKAMFFIFGLLTAVLFMGTNYGFCETSQPYRRATKPAESTKNLEPGQKPVKAVRLYKISIEKFELTDKCQIKLVLKNVGADLIAEQYKKSYLKVGHSPRVSLSTLRGDLRKKNGESTYHENKPLSAPKTLKATVTLFNGSKTNSTKTLTPNCPKMNRDLKTGAIQTPQKEVGKKIATRKREKTLPAIEKLATLKIKKTYVKDNRIHVILQNSGFRKLSRQDLNHAKLEIRQDTKTEIVSFKNKKSLLNRLVSFGGEVDFGTGIKVKKDGVITVQIKGLKGGYTAQIKKKVEMGNLTPLKKQVNIAPPLKVPEKKWQFPKSKFWDLSIESISIHWENQQGNKGKAVYNPDKNDPHSQVEPVYIWHGQEYMHNPYNPKSVKFRFSVNAKVKSIPKSQITKADVAKWGSQLAPTFKTSIVIGKYHNKEYTGWSYNSEKDMKEGLHRYAPLFTWDDVQQWPEEGKEYFLNRVIFFSWEKSLHGLEIKPGTLTSDQYIVAVKLGDVQNNKFPRFFFHPENLPIKMIPPDSTNWIIGSKQAIKWKINGIKKRMRIVLFRGEGPVGNAYFKRIGKIADNIAPPPPGAGSTTMTYQWRVGDLIENQSGLQNTKETEALAVKNSETNLLYYIRIEVPEQDDGIPIFSHDKFPLKFVDHKKF